MVRRVATLLTLALVAAACSNSSGRDRDEGPVTAPKPGACRDLSPGDVDEATDSTPVVACSEEHTAETFAVGTLPSGTGSAYEDKRHGAFVFDTCSAAFRDYLGVDESLAMRIRLTWAWFRPSRHAWDDGARWYRCDVVGGPDGARSLADLPATAKGLFDGERPDAWLACARGTTVTASVKVACSEPHDWRAVTTIKVGQPADPYPGDRIVQVRSRDRCSDWIGAWLHYPPDYEYGYTWFHEAEWSTGNRRSICWTRTDR